MSTTTEKLGLTKLDLSDAADITALNSNWDKIDDEIASPKGRLSSTISTTEDADPMLEAVFNSMEDGTITHHLVKSPEDWGMAFDGLPTFVTIRRIDSQTGSMTAVQSQGRVMPLTLERWCCNGVWYEWRYVNPPSYVGVEYPTTDHFMGQMVSTKIISCGALPQSGTKTISHDLSIGQIVRYAAQATHNGTALPRDWNGKISVFADRENIYITTDIDFEGEATVQLWYTKGGE